MSATSKTIPAPKGGYKITDEQAVRDFLDKAHGRARSHTVGFATVVEIVRDLERKLAQHGLLADQRTGAWGYYVGAGAWAKAYKYAVPASSFAFRRFHDGWRIMEAGTTARFPRADSETYVVLTNEQRAVRRATPIKTPLRKAA